MADVYDRIYFGNESYDYKTGRKQFIAKMEEYFPEESKAIHEYVSLIRKVSRAASTYYMEKSLPPFFPKFSTRN